MSASNTKTILLELHNQSPKSGDPDFAYLEIGKFINDNFLKARAFLKESDFSAVTQHDFLAPFFVCVSELGDHQNEAERYTPDACSLVVDGDQFWINVMLGEGRDAMLGPVSFNNLDALPSDDKIEKIQLSYVSEWDGDDDIETTCLMNPRSGELEIVSSDVDRDGILVGEFVTDSEGNDYRVFSHPESYIYFVAPRDLKLLLDNQASQSPGF